LTRMLFFQARRTSTATRATALCALPLAGASPRVSTTVSADASRARLLCPRYVVSGFAQSIARGSAAPCWEMGGEGGSHAGTIGLACIALGGHSLDRPGQSDLHWEAQWLTDPLFRTTTDRLWLQQEDQAHDALRPQGLPCQQRQGRRAPPHAQPDLRCRVRSHPPIHPPTLRGLR